MASNVQVLSFYHATVQDDAGDGYELLEQLADQGINLRGFHAVPMVSGRTQMTLFPEDDAALAVVAQRAGLKLAGPHRAVLVQGDDRSGALARVYKLLRESDVHIYSSIGLAAGEGRYGCMLFVRDDEAEHASRIIADAGHSF